MSEKHIGGFILLYSVSLRQGGPLCPNLLYYIVYVYITIHNILSKTIKAVLFCFYFKITVSQKGVHIETILFILSTEFMRVLILQIKEILKSDYK